MSKNEHRRPAIAMTRVTAACSPLWIGRRASAEAGPARFTDGFRARVDALVKLVPGRSEAARREKARELVLFLRRPGGQPQVSVSLASQASEMTTNRELP